VGAEAGIHETAVEFAAALSEVTSGELTERG
jgi:hypothetical protein